MDYKIIRARDTKTASWSGGTTTELYIYPEDSNFQQRDFLFRISRATVEVEQSDFTPLPGVNRTLMVLEGSLKLMHENHHESMLNPFEQDSFKGDWSTKSIGKVTDFNLMLRENTKGLLEHMKVSGNLPWTATEHADFHLFYVASGSANVLENKLQKGDLLILRSGNQLEVNSENCDLIHVSVFLK